VPDVELRIPLGAMLPEAMEHGNPGLVAVRGFQPWPTGGWRPYSYFVKPTVNLGGQVYGGHYHVWGSVWECYVARDDGGDVGITRVTLQAGSPPSTLAIGSTLDVTGTPWGSQTLVEHGYQFVSFGQHVLVAGDESLQIQARDSTGSSAFADAIPSGSVDRPSGRFIANAGPRIVLAYITHNSTTSRDNYGSSALVDENLVVFSGLKSGYSYFSTENTTSGDNKWDPEELAEHYRLIDGLGIITGHATSAHGFGWIWKEHGLYRFDYQQGPADFRLISAEHGTRSPQSIVVVEDTAYWVDQNGHSCRVGGSGGVEDLSSTSLLSALLEDDAVFMGRYPEDDLTQGKNTAAATAFAYGATERFRASLDLETIFSASQTVYRYPQGFYDASSGTVRWIYPGTHDRMQGVGSVTGGTTTFTWTSGQLFDDSNNSFMDGRAIDLDDGGHSTTVSSVTNREALELAAGPVGTLTDVDWFILFQRYLELVFQPATDSFSVTDVTHAWNKTTGQRPWQMHWGISAPGFGLRLSQPAGVPQRMAYAPQGVLYAFAYLQSGGGDFYSLTYGWPYGTAGGVDQGGYLLLEDPQFVTSYVGIASDQSESAIASRPVAIRPVYSSRQRAHDLEIDVTLNVVVLTKWRAGQDPRVSNTMSFDMDAVPPPGDARGWLSLNATVEGQWHQIVLWFGVDPFTDNDPANAFEVISSIDYFELRLTSGAT